MTLPNSTGGRITQRVAYFRSSADRIAELLTRESDQYRRIRCESRILANLVDTLQQRPIRDRIALIPMKDWTLLLTSGPHGTDPGGLPRLAAKSWGIDAIVAMAADDDGLGFPATSLELFSADAIEEPTRCVRVIYAIKDGSRWSFGDHGEPLEFENTNAFMAKRIPDRFTPGMVRNYLGELGVPDESHLQVERTVLIEHRS